MCACSGFKSEIIVFSLLDLESNTKLDHRPEAGPSFSYRLHNKLANRVRQANRARPSSGKNVFWLSQTPFGTGTTIQKHFLNN